MLSLRKHTATNPHHGASASSSLSRYIQHQSSTTNYHSYRFLTLFLLSFTFLTVHLCGYLWEEKQYNELPTNYNEKNAIFNVASLHRTRSIVDKLTEGQRSMHKEGKEAKEKLHTRLQILKWKEQQQSPGPMESAKCKASKDKKEHSKCIKHIHRSNSSKKAKQADRWEKLRIKQGLRNEPKWKSANETKQLSHGKNLKEKWTEGEKHGKTLNEKGRGRKRGDDKVEVDPKGAQQTGGQEKGKCGKAKSKSQWHKLAKSVVRHRKSPKLRAAELPKLCAAPGRLGRRELPKLCAAPGFDSKAPDFSKGPPATLPVDFKSGRKSTPRKRQYKCRIFLNSP